MSGKTKQLSCPISKNKGIVMTNPKFPPNCEKVSVYQFIQQTINWSSSHPLTHTTVTKPSTWMKYSKCQEQRWIMKTHHFSEAQTPWGEDQLLNSNYNVISDLIKVCGNSEILRSMCSTIKNLGWKPNSGT